MTEHEFLREFFRITGEHDCHDEFFWRVNGPDPVKIIVICNDLFQWASGDCEDLTPENIGALEAAFVDAEKAEKHGEVHGAALFCARQRKERPQRPCYKSYSPAIAALFDQCGPPK